MEPKYLNLGATKARTEAIGWWNTVQSLIMAIDRANRNGLDIKKLVAAALESHEFEKYLWDHARTQAAIEAGIVQRDEGGDQE